MSRAVLAFEGVSYRYPGASDAALRDVSVELHAGEFCVLAGLSGSGKSTLLRAACGLVPHFHGGDFAGRAIVAGLDTREHGPARIGAFAGALFQDPETQLVSGSVRAELSLALESRGGGPTAVARGVEEVALALGIDAILDRPTQELSGGEQQRVALGAALAGRPRIVLLDEPTSQLDPVAGDELIGLLRRLNQEWETTVLLCEHRLERCLSAADRVIALDRGRVASDSDPRTFLRWAALHAPALQTPGARLFSLARLPDAPASVKEARTSLRAHGLLVDADARAAGTSVAPRPSARGGVRRRLRRTRRASDGGDAAIALSMRGVWHELRSGPAVLRGITLEVERGETVALMGRNGAGKSTLLRHAAGLLEPTRGRIERGGRVALLLQNPGDYLIHERVADEASADALRAAGLESLAERHPRDLSGGERQRLALAIVSGSHPPTLLALDEPTRGMDREAKATLAAALRERAAAGQAVIVATHDPEFAAACAERAILLADGRVIADGAARELLAGGWYFATETARILGGAGDALLPEDGAEFLAAARADGRAGSSPALEVAQ
jgi:energy-coupling factor transporter ATP-binding protein EcfA2